MSQLQKAAAAGTHALRCELAGEVLSSSGTMRLRATGWSMLPTIVQGDVLVFAPTNRDELSEGDIVLFGRNERLFAHRVLSISRGHRDGHILTQGDALPTPDLPVADSELIGRVSRIERNGRQIKPVRALGFSDGAIAAVLRRSRSVVRVVFKILRMRQSLKESGFACQS